MPKKGVSWERDRVGVLPNSEIRTTISTMWMHKVSDLDPGFY